MSAREPNYCCPPPPSQRRRRRASDHPHISMATTALDSRYPVERKQVNFTANVHEQHETGDVAEGDNKTGRDTQARRQTQPHGTAPRTTAIRTEAHCHLFGILELLGAWDISYPALAMHTTLLAKDHIFPRVSVGPLIHLGESFCPALIPFSESNNLCRCAVP